MSWSSKSLLVQALQMSTGERGCLHMLISPLIPWWRNQLLASRIQRQRDGIRGQRNTENQTAVLCSPHQIMTMNLGELCI